MRRLHFERKFFIQMLRSRVELESAAIKGAQLRITTLLMIGRFPIRATGLMLTLLVLSSCYGPLDWFDGPRPEGQPMPPPIVPGTPTPTVTPVPSVTPTSLEEPEESPTENSDS